MKKFYVTSQFTRDEENSIEVLVRGASIVNEGMWSTLVVFDNKDAAEVLNLLKKAGIPVDYMDVQNEYTLRVCPVNVAVTTSESGTMFGYYPQLRTLVLEEGEYSPKRNRKK